LRYVRRIAAALLALRNAGHAKYTAWQYTFYCECDVDSALKDQAKAMENELQHWREEIVQLRKDYHALNYFTTQQLRVIRQKLGQLECKTISSLPVNVLFILMSISCEITEENVLDALKNTKGQDYDDTTGGPNLDGNIESSVSKNKSSADIGQVIAEDEVSIESAIEKKVKLLSDQLNEAHQMIFNSLVDCGYPETVAYLGIKYCTQQQSENLTETCVGDWCMKNELKYEKMEKQALLEEIDSQNISKPDCTALETTVDDTTQDASVMQSDNSAEIDATEKYLVDEFDFPSGLAREAAKLYPDDHDKAVKYCIEKESASISNPIFHSAVTSSLRTNEDEKRYVL